MSVACDVLIEDTRWNDRLNAEELVNAAVAKAAEVAQCLLHPDAEASFTFADDAFIRNLNAQWRSKDAPTNVLSFPANSLENIGKSPLLGDVILAYETIDREAIDEGKAFVHHATHMIVHGFLHLIGFDHQDDAEASAMEKIESEVLLKLGAPDPWLDDLPAKEA